MGYVSLYVNEPRTSFVQDSLPDFSALLAVHVVGIESAAKKFGSGLRRILRTPSPMVGGGVALG